jgi:hypothetical protein
LFREDQQQQEPNHRQEQHDVQQGHRDAPMNPM